MKNVVSAGLVATLAVSAPYSVQASDFGRAVGAIIGGVVSGAIQRDQQQRQQQHRQQQRAAPQQTRPAVSQAQRQRTREVQQALNHFEFSAGAADGLMGPNTRGAIRRYQGAMGFPVSGELTDTQRDFLIASRHRAEHSGSIAPYDRILAQGGPQALLEAFRDEQRRASAGASQTGSPDAGDRPVTGADADGTANISYEGLRALLAQDDRAASDAGAASEGDPAAQRAAFTRDIQRNLRALDLYRGAIDGIIGRGTRRGLRNFQRQAGLPDEIDNRSLALLLAAATIRQDRGGSAEAAIRDAPEFITGITEFAQAQSTAQAEGPSEALPLYRSVLRRARAVMGDDSMYTANAMHVLADALEQAGEFDEAGNLYAQSHDLLQGMYGADNPDTLGAADSLANIRMRQGRHDEATTLFRETLDRRTRSVGESHPDVFLSRYNLARVTLSTGDVAAGESELAQIHQAARDVMSPEDPLLAAMQHDLVTARLHLEQPDAAKALLRDVIDDQRDALGEQHPATLRTQAALGATLVKQGDIEAGEDLLEQALDGHRATLGSTDPATLAVERTISAISSGETREPAPGDAGAAASRALMDEIQPAGDREISVAGPEISVDGARIETAQAAPEPGTQPVDMDRLPFPDGTYTIDPRYCSMTPGEAGDLGDGIATVQQVIEGRQIERGYEVSCEIEAVSADGDLLSVEAGCMAEGFREARDWTVERVSPTAFIERGGFLDGERFELCGQGAGESEQGDATGAAEARAVHDAHGSGPDISGEDARPVLRRTFRSFDDQGSEVEMSVAAQHTGSGVRVTLESVSGQRVDGARLNAVDAGENFDMGLHVVTRETCAGCTPDFVRQSEPGMRLRDDVIEPQELPVGVTVPQEALDGADVIGLALYGNDLLFLAPDSHFPIAELEAAEQGAREESSATMELTHEESLFGPHAVIDFDDANHCIFSEGWNEFRDCLDEAGASDAGIAAARELSSGDSQALLSNYRPTGGPVDIAEIQVPAAGNTSRQGFVRHGREFDLVGLERMEVQDAASRELKRRYPDAVSFNPARVASHRNLGDGGQRFILTAPVTDGCRACDVVATAIGYVDFLDGELVEEGTIGWAPQRGAYRTDDAEIRRRLHNGDVLEAQIQLNRLGYIAGPMDGAFGPMTQAALEEFQRDHCLEFGTDWRNTETIEALASSGGLDADPAPCAAGGAAASGAVASDGGSTAAAGDGLTHESSGPDLFNIFSELMVDYCVGRDCAYYASRETRRCDEVCNIEGHAGEYVAHAVTNETARTLAERATEQTHMISQQGVPYGFDGSLKAHEIMDATPTQVFRHGCESSGCDSLLFVIEGEGSGHIFEIPGKENSAVDGEARALPDSETVSHDSVYSELDTSNACEMLYRTPEGEPGHSAILLCPGVEGYEVIYGDIHLRMQMAYRRSGQADANSRSDWQSVTGSGFTGEGFAEFNHVHDTIEWRRAEIEGQRIPVATIHRWFVQMEPDEERPILVVSTVAHEPEDESCMVGYVDAAENPYANALARRIADDVAPGFTCGIDEAQGYGTVAERTPQPFSVVRNQAAHAADGEARGQGTTNDGGGAD